MKKDKLQARKLYRLSYEFAPNNFEYISIGADKDIGYFTLRLKAIEILKKKYPNATIEKIEIL